MAKVLFHKDKSYFISDPSKDFHFMYGFVTAADLKKSGKVTSSMGKECTVIEASFVDNFKKIKRLAQIITPKDAGLILAETMAGQDSIVVDAGGGSGALTCFLARYVKKVYCFEKNDENVKVINKNIERLGLINIEVRKQDVYEAIPVKKADVVTLDLAEPHKAFDHVAACLVPGGFLVCYVPCTNQIQTLVNDLENRDDFFVIKTVELQERYWKVKGQAVRPDTHGALHTGFLTFIRKI